ncbi:hypothetical protein NA78x_000826 [Anatilimnocola sp. NA78]|uniref:hypothetical protein n=1 Tax=Anatilimnocola sp. NA78 TaxID=3415683 RepID=UPI003CE4A037
MLSYLGQAVVLLLFAATVLFHILMCSDRVGIQPLVLLSQPDLLTSRGKWYRRASLMSLFSLIALSIIGGMISSIFAVRN